MRLLLRIPAPRCRPRRLWPHLPHVLKAGSARADPPAAVEEELRAVLASARAAALAARAAAERAELAAAAAQLALDETLRRSRGGGGGEAAAASTVSAGRSTQLATPSDASAPPSTPVPAPLPAAQPARPSLAAHYVSAPHRVLPRRVILVRNAQSAANVDPTVLARVPGPEIPLSAEGHAQAAASGHRIRDMLEREDGPGGTSLFLYVSPFRRSKETALGIMAQQSACLLGCREEPQLREQDTGQLQDLSAQERENMLRRSFSRFFFRFTSGESGSDVYDRLTAFLDHMMRDIDGGRFPEGTTLLVVTHGLALRLFLARWFHWTVHDFDSVGNPPYGEPVVLELVPGAEASSCSVTGLCTKTKDLYRLAEASLPLLGVSGRQELRTMLQPQDAWGRTMERTVAGAAG